MISYYINEVTHAEIRWDPAQVRNGRNKLPGRAGINHWHRIDINKSGYFLDSCGKICNLCDDQSVLAPKEQIDIDYNDVAYNDEIIDEINTKFITLLDKVTSSWLHDSKIKNIIVEKNEVIIEFEYYNQSSNILIIKFIRNNGVIEQESILKFIAKDIYRLKLHKRNLDNELEIITTDNDHLLVFYDDINYEEKSV
jgi:hypothetical protein